MNTKHFEIYVVESLFQPEENAPGQVLFCCDSWELVVERLARLAAQMSVKSGNWDIYRNNGSFFAQMELPYGGLEMFRITQTRLYANV